MIYAFIQEGLRKILLHHFENTLSKAAQLKVILSLKNHKGISPLHLASLFSEMFYRDLWYQLQLMKWKCDLNAIGQLV